jgi:hypothetical protein
MERREAGDEGVIRSSPPRVGNSLLPTEGEEGVPHYIGAPRRVSYTYMGTSLIRKHHPRTTLGSLGEAFSCERGAHVHQLVGSKTLRVVEADVVHVPIKGRCPRPVQDHSCTGLPRA